MSDLTIYQKGNFVHTLSNIEESFPAMDLCTPNDIPFNPIPEIPFEPMEFLSRSWSSSSIEVMQALSPNSQEKSRAMVVSPFSVTSSSLQFTSSEDCRSPTDLCPLIPKRDSRCGMEKFSNQEEFPPTPRLAEDLKAWLWMQQTIHPELNLGKRLQKKLFPRNMTCLKTMLQASSIKKWIKDLKDKKKEEIRLHNAQLHAAISVAGVAAALAAIAAGHINEDSESKTNVAVASAAALVAAQCVEVAENMGADRHKISSVVTSAVNAKNAGDILTLTAAAATSLRGATTLKSRPKKENHKWSHSSVIPFEKDGSCTPKSPNGEDTMSGNSDADFCNSRALLAKGTELLLHIANGKPVWKNVCVFLNIDSQLILKVRSKHIGGAFIKVKESVILEVEAWPRNGLNQDDEHSQFLLMRTSGGTMEFEFKDHFEHQLWTFTISRLSMYSSQIKLE
ncbi:VAN3-binding protein isoform X1 [Cryptomeria japonica]|uniref:VAN3-binding protein isoform X1 n=1 Tax=Cryptomeria japonica TaxID=3369 RepID=UPI0025AD7BC1|nr:VAN3-binding protein isoform X1 [Cryptomeria japonica]XP_057832587.1 VAN3-binding protein isoform X1 [Cryptomeria japonica]XP_057832588.1 VAN3-binding protein isoform X1 [Cryptomeria japonica]